MDVERASARRAYLNRSRSFRRRPIRKVAKISDARYGRETTVKMSMIKTYDSTSGGLVNYVDGIVALLQLSPDWANYSSSFQLFNINKIKVQLLMGATPPGDTGQPQLDAVGICYSTKDNTALTSLEQLVDHNNFSVIGTANADSSVKNFFNVRARPKIKPPQSTSDTTENFGWLKYYSDTFSASVFVMKVIVTFEVTFSAES